MKKFLLILFVASTLVFINFCGDKKADKPAEDKQAEKEVEGKAEKKAEVKPEGEPDRITVQHLLIAFKGTIPGEKVTRSQEEAKTLAYELLEKVKDGADFDVLVKEYTDDSHPGIYSMSNFGVEPKKEPREFPRTGMVKAFGNVGFPLGVGEVGIADYDLGTSKYGWHIIKRIK